MNLAQYGILVNCRHCYLVLETMKITFNYTDLSPLKLCQAIVDVLKTIHSYGLKTNQKVKKRVRHHDISITNILVLILKDTPIHLDNKTFVQI